MKVWLRLYDAIGEPTNGLLISRTIWFGGEIKQINPVVIDKKLNIYPIYRTLKSTKLRCIET